MHIDLNSIGVPGNNERIQGTFKRPLGINATGVIRAIKKPTKIFSTRLDGFDIPLVI
jgi:hypothetical protein